MVINKMLRKKQKRAYLVSSRALEKPAWSGKNLAYLRLLEFLDNVLVLGFILFLAAGCSVWFIFNKQQSNLESLTNEISKLDKEIAGASLIPNDKMLLKDTLQLKKEVLGFKKDQTNARNAVYSNTVQSIAGIFFFVTAFFSWRNLRIAQASLKSTEEKQITERLAKALDHLDSTNLTIKLGAIYTLERIAKESIKDFRFIIDILASLIRISSTNQEPSSNTRHITQAALTAIGDLVSSLSIEENYQSIDASNSILIKVAFVNLTLRGINLENSDLREANLDGVDLRDANLAKVDFSGAYLGRADLDCAILIEAKLNEVNLVGGREVKQVILTNANLRDAEIINAQLARAKFSGSDLSSAKLNNTNFRDADFTKAKLTGANLGNSDLSKANLTDANLVNTILDDADIHEAILFGVKVSDPELIKKAKNWESANYDEKTRKKLGLTK